MIKHFEFKGLCHKILNCAGRKVYIKRLIKKYDILLHGSLYHQQYF